MMNDDHDDGINCPFCLSWENIAMLNVQPDLTINDADFFLLDTFSGIILYSVIYNHYQLNSQFI